MKITSIFLTVLCAGIFLTATSRCAEETTVSPAPAAPTAGAPAEKTSETATAQTATASEQFTGPAAEVKKQMEELFEVSKKVNLPGAEGSKARAEIGNSVDWERISLDCIGRAAWKKQSAAKQAEFKKLLREVIEKTAYSRLDKFWKGATYRFEKINIKGTEGTVPTKFIVDGKAFQLEYFVNEKRNKWTIHDIAYEGEQYSSNIHDQIEAFLKEKPFSDLLEKLRKRRDELSSESSPKRG